MIGHSVAAAARYLKEGKVVGIPTETVYGLAGNAYDLGAVAQIFKIKQRPYEDPLIVHCRDQEAALGLVEGCPPPARRLAEAFWPGALTMLLPKKEIIPALVTAGNMRVGVRVPSHPITRRLLQRLPFPLAAPSANPFGYISPTTATHVADQLGDALPYILDGGTCQLGLESTIVGFDGGKVVVYRLGSIALEAIEQVMGAPVVFHKSKAQGALQAPGTSLSHYAPRTRLVVGEVAKLLAQHADKRVGVLLLQGKVTAAHVCHQVALSSTGNLEEAAAHLFAALRVLDQKGCDLLIAPPFPNVGMGRTINERLARASHRA